ncbi:unnamed protein product [marine sediment metagenome]|uniref:Uncharacterized protein n=1 Tax=marine sediment metagenome TaxID=412755 RepID=X1CQI1_9ZZZZ
MTENNEKQIRFTREDTLSAQKSLRILLLKKIETNSPLTGKERETYESTLSKAYNAQATVTKVSMTFPNGHITDVYENLHEFALKLMDMTSNKVAIPLFNVQYVFDISELWSVMYSNSLRCFPWSLRESLQVSKERTKKDRPTSYVFSGDGKL